MNWKNALVRAGSTLGEAIKIIDKSNLQIAIAINDKKEIEGILTDGDARRGIKHYAKNITLKKFMTTSPLFISENSTFI